MRRLITRVMSLFFVLSLILGATLTLGRQHPTSPRLTMLRLTDCAPPCWIGIVPGRTTIDEARSRITAIFGHSPAYQVFFDPTSSSADLEVTLEGELEQTTPILISFQSEGDSVIRFIQFELPYGDLDPASHIITLGDLHTVLGAPSRLLVSDEGYFLGYGDDQRGAFILPASADYPQLHEPAISLTFYDSVEKNFVDAYPWRGFSQRPYEVQCDADFEDPVYC